MNVLRFLVRSYLFLDINFVFSSLLFLLQVNPILWVAGQIGLIPGKMTLVEGGWNTEGVLSLQHVSSVLGVHGVGMDQCALVTVFVADTEALPHVQALWDNSCDKVRTGVCVDCKVCFSLFITQPTLYVCPFSVFLFH